MTRFTFSAATVAMIACPAFGTITVGVDVSTDNGKVANSLNVTTTQPWTGANLYVELTQGSVINLDTGLGGANTAPNQSEINADPALLFDTYVGRVGTTDDLLGSALELGGVDLLGLGPSGISASWAVALGSGVPISNLAIGNFVFSGDAVGTWSLGITEVANAQAKFIGGTLSAGQLNTDFVPGDLNVDGFTGIDDLNIVLGEWNTDGSGDPRSDPSGDGFVGIDDLNNVLGDWNAGAAQGPWSYSNPGGQPGDLDGDDFLGLSDLSLLLENWHKNIPPGNPLADPSGDGFVGLDDMNILSSFWGGGISTPPPLVVVPEPTGLVLLSLATLGLLRKRQA